MFHGTSEDWAARIVNEGQRANMSSRGRAGPGLYVTSDINEARGYARNAGGFEHAVVEGIIPEPNVYHMSRSEAAEMDARGNVPAKDYDPRYLTEFSARIRKQGYNVIRMPSSEETDHDYHVVIRPKTFVPTKIHYRDGTVSL